jgi:simple sugar transport system permease protein
MVVALLHAWLSISVRADQIISGTIINIAAFGLTGYLNELISRSSPTSAGAFTQFQPPPWLVQIPLVGWLFNMFLNQGPITMSVLVIVWFCRSSRFVAGPAHAGDRRASQGRGPWAST